MIDGQKEQNLGLHKPKAKWNEQEDALLLEVIKERGPSNWNLIAESLPGRTGKQCRERWICKLSPAYKNDSWTTDEDDMLIKLQAQFGNKWAHIRSFLPGRSSVSIKNRWVSLCRRGKHQPPPITNWEDASEPFVECEYPIESFTDICDDPFTIDDMFASWV